MIGDMRIEPPPRFYLLPPDMVLIDGGRPGRVLVYPLRGRVEVENGAGAVSHLIYTADGWRVERTAAGKIERPPAARPIVGGLGWVGGDYLIIAEMAGAIIQAPRWSVVLSLDELRRRAGMEPGPGALYWFHGGRWYGDSI